LKPYKKAVIAFVLAVMFGIGWIFGVLGSDLGQGPLSQVFQFVFIFIVGFQGLLIFLLHPCRSKDVRSEWKKWFYYATCRSKVHLHQATVSAQKNRAKHASSTPSIKNPAHSGLATTSFSIRSQGSLDDISITSFAGSTLGERSSSVPSLNSDIPSSTVALNPAHLQKPALATVIEEPFTRSEEVPHLSDSLSSGDSFYIFGNEHVEEPDIDDDSLN
jgi:hypothetical protein